MKSLIALFLAISVSLTLASCGGKDKDTATDASTNGGEPLSTTQRADDDTSMRDTTSSIAGTSESESESDTVIPD